MNWLKDTNNKRSVTLTTFISGFIIACIKLLLSGVQITADYKIPEFTSSDFAMVVGTVGGLYLGRRHNSMEKSGGSDEQS